MTKSINNEHKLSFTFKIGEHVRFGKKLCVVRKKAGEKCLAMRGIMGWIYFIPLDWSQVEKISDSKNDVSYPSILHQVKHDEMYCISCNQTIKKQNLKRHDNGMKHHDSVLNFVKANKIS